MCKILLQAIIVVRVGNPRGETVQLKTFHEQTERTQSCDPSNTQVVIDGCRVQWLCVPCALLPVCMSLRSSLQTVFFSSATHLIRLLFFVLVHERRLWFLAEVKDLACACVKQFFQLKLICKCAYDVAMLYCRTSVVLLCCARYSF